MVHPRTEEGNSSDVTPLAPRVEERALEPLRAELLLCTGARLVVQRVIVALLPAMAELALLLVRAAFVVLADEGARLPVEAHLVRVQKHMRLTAKILPVVCVNALCLVVLLREWTPLGLKVVQVEVKVVRQLVNQRDLYFFLRVSKRAESTVLAASKVLREKRAELRLVLFWVVQALDFVVCEPTRITERALISFLVLAEFRTVHRTLAPPVFQAVEELAVFVVVLTRYRALLRFERIQVHFLEHTFPRPKRRLIHRTGELKLICVAILWK